MPADDLILLMRRLSLFLRAGIPIHRALGLIAEDSKRKSTVRVITALSEDILQGKRFSDALARFPRIFDSLHISMIQVGELSGGLALQLEQLALLGSQRRDATHRLIGAAVYPLIIVCATIGMTGFLTLFAFPKIVPLFKGFHRTLPFPTRVLIGITNFASQFGWILSACLVLLSISIVLLLRLLSVRRVIDRISLRLPFLSGIIRSFYSAFITRTLATLLESGVGILPALDILAQGMRHSSYVEALHAMRVRISEGCSIAEGLSEYPALFPHVISQLVSAGELTGTLPESLRHAAQIFEHYLDEQSHLISTLIEPVLMIGMGLVVGFIALAIITPIYSITQSISVN